MQQSVANVRKRENGSLALQQDSEDTPLRDGSSGGQGGREGGRERKRDEEKKMGKCV